MVASIESIAKDPKMMLRLAIGAACAGVPVSQVQAALEEIVVTSTKRSENMQDIPVAVTAFTDEEIVRQGFKTFSDYAGQIPSLAISERQPGATSVLMRGCAAQGLSFSDNATTSVYLDEQPITAAGYNPDPRLIDIARLEALSGPQGTLFGEAAQCGTLRIITNKPDSTEFNSWVDVTGMTVDGGDTGYDISAMVNIPIVADTLALRLVGFVAEEPGFVDNVLSPSPGSNPNLGVDPGENFDNSAQVKKDVNSGQYYGGRAGLRWNATEKWSVDLNGIYQKHELDGFGEVDLNVVPDGTGQNASYYPTGSVFPTLGKYDQVRFGTEDWEDEWYQLSVTTEGNLGFADLVVTGAYFNRKSEYNADATAYVQAFQQLSNYIKTTSPYYNVYDFNGDPRASAFNGREADNYTLEARLSSLADSDSRWGWIGGVFYNHREVTELFTSNVNELWDVNQWDFNTYSGKTPAGYYLNYSIYNVNAGGSARSNNWFTGTYDSKLDQYAVFGEISFDITENFTVTAGGRWYDVENEFTIVQAALVGENGGIPNCTIDYCFTGANDVGKSDESGFVPKVNLSYTWNDKLFYFTYSEGFRRGGANSARPNSVFGVPGAFPPPAGTLNQYTSDDVTNYEIGAKTEWFDNALRLNITAYTMKWDDIQVQASDPQPGIFSLGIVNAPEATMDGVDVWLAWAPTESWDLSTTVGWNNAEISESFVLNNNVGVEKGTRLPLMPEWKVSLNATYTFTGELLSATPFVLASYVYTGDSTNSLGIESSNFSYPVREQPSWQTVDVRAGLDGATWSASVYIDNVTDEYAELFYNNRWAQQRLSVNQPRTLGVNFRKYFGARD